MVSYFNKKTFFLWKKRLVFLYSNNTIHTSFLLDLLHCWRHSSHLVLYKKQFFIFWCLISIKNIFLWKKTTCFIYSDNTIHTSFFLLDLLHCWRHLQMAPLCPPYGTWCARSQRTQKTPGHADCPWGYQWIWSTSLIWYCIPTTVNYDISQCKVVDLTLFQSINGVGDHESKYIVTGIELIS